MHEAVFGMEQDGPAITANVVDRRFALDGSG